MAEDVQVYFEDVEIGTELPKLTVALGRLQLFLFSAATYNAHRVHFDRDWAVDVEGYPDTLVHGPLQAALLARVVTDWCGGRGVLVRYKVENRAPAFPGQDLTFGATVVAKRCDTGRGLLDLDIQGSRAGDLLMPGQATVAVPSRRRRR